MTNSEEQRYSDPPDEIDPLVLGEAALKRAKAIARRIAERVRRLTEDTGPEQKALDGTDEHPPAE